MELKPLSDEKLFSVATAAMLEVVERLSDQELGAALMNDDWCQKKLNRRRDDAIFIINMISALKDAYL